ncbi:hypothetical protein BC827DRAFT_1154412 [Russula dissimulans]|nr:hypothetical protein BC827DRAFT_1154412 [Russula dissimulans]
MSQQRQENRDKRAEPAPNREHDDDYDYDEFLFWPSLSNRHVASTSNSSPLYGPVSLSSESDGGYSWGSGSSLRPPSPLVFAPIVNWGSVPPVDSEDSVNLGTAPSHEPEAGGQHIRGTSRRVNCLCNSITPRDANANSRQRRGSLARACVCTRVEEKDASPPRRSHSKYLPAQGEIAQGQRVGHGASQPSIDQKVNDAGLRHFVEVLVVSYHSSQSAAPRVVALKCAFGESLARRRGSSKARVGARSHEQ